MCYPQCQRNYHPADIYDSNLQDISVIPLQNLSNNAMCADPPYSRATAMATSRPITVLLVILQAELFGTGDGLGDGEGSGDAAGDGSGDVPAGSACSSSMMALTHHRPAEMVGISRVRPLPQYDNSSSVNEPLMCNQDISKHRAYLTLPGITYIACKSSHLITQQ